jgi:diguanylate cyclase (GGDEF)-like protein
MQNKEGILQSPTFIERKKIKKLAEHAITDDSMQVYDKSLFFLDLEEEAERAKRYGSAFSIIILDIDNFKNLNDTYGHMIGDSVLQSIADTLKRNVRRTDTVYRYGGDEFVVLLPETGKESAGSIAEKTKKFLEDIRINGANVRLNLSMGVATYEDNNYRAGKEVFHDADMALYRAKESGKNKIYESTADGFNEIHVNRTF